MEGIKFSVELYMEGHQFFRAAASFNNTIKPAAVLPGTHEKPRAFCGERYAL